MRGKGKHLLAKPRHASGKLREVGDSVEVSGPEVYQKLPIIHDLANPVLEIKNISVFNQLLNALVLNESFLERTSPNYGRLKGADAKALKFKLQSWASTKANDKLALSHQAKEWPFNFNPHRITPFLEGSSMTLDHLFEALHRKHPPQGEDITLNPHYPRTSIELLEIAKKEVSAQIQSQLVSVDDLPDNLYSINDLHTLLKATQHGVESEVIRPKKGGHHDSKYYIKPKLEIDVMFHNLVGIPHAPAEALIIKTIAWQVHNKAFDSNFAGTVNSNQISTMLHEHPNASRTNNSPMHHKARFLADFSYICQELSISLKKKKTAQLLEEITNDELLKVIERLKKSLFAERKRYNEERRSIGGPYLSYHKPMVSK